MKLLTFPPPPPTSFLLLPSPRTLLHPHHLLLFGAVGDILYFVQVHNCIMILAGILKDSKSKSEIISAPTCNTRCLPKPERPSKAMGVIPPAAAEDWNLHAFMEAFLDVWCLPWIHACRINYPFAPLKKKLQATELQTEPSQVYPCPLTSPRPPQSSFLVCSLQRWQRDQEKRASMV